MNTTEHLTESMRSSKLIFDGVVVHLYEDHVTLPNGQDAVREYVKHIGAVAVLPLTENNEVLCVRQYRYPFHNVLTEIPAGKLDSADEDHIEAALRELREETGARCQSLTYLGAYYSSPAILDEKIDLYLAEGLSFGEIDPDEDEFIEPARIPLSQLVDEVLSGEIRDGKTQATVLKVNELLHRRAKETSI